MVGRLAPRLFGRDIASGSQHPSVLCEAGHRERPGDSEIADLDDFVRGYQYVLRLDIAVNNTVAMRVGECVDYLARDIGDGICGKRRALIDQFLERLSVYVFHDDIVDAVGIAGIVYGGDIPVDEAGSGMGFPLEALDKMAVVRKTEMQYFYRHRTVEHRVERPVDRSHAAAPYGFVNPVTPLDDLPAHMPPITYLLLLLARLYPRRS